MQKPSIEEVLNKTLASGVTTLNTFEKADKSKAGRKKIPKEQRTDKIVHFYLTEAQLNSLKEIAEEDCLSVQAFVKKEVLKLLKSKEAEAINNNH